MSRMSANKIEIEHLSDSQIDFLRLVSSAAIANPFGLERDVIDRDLLSRLTDASGHLDAKSIGTETQKLLLKAGFSGQKSIASARPSVRQVLYEAALFAVFHRFMDDFDNHIHEQQNSPGNNLKMPFATAILDELESFGFENQSEQIISLFFQMRRAFFFISNLVSGEAPCIRELRVHLWRSLFTHDLRFYLSSMHENLESFSIMLLGETGVGKSQAAAALGRCAHIPFSRKTGAFNASFLDIYIPANISEFSTNLAESELFGHKKGSFTGALESYDGLLGRTHVNGVLFLDEIGELSHSLQVKLLRVLQERVYSPVGSHEQRRFAGRLVSATNADLFDKMQSGAFRSDLYYRLASDVIQIPPLRQRFQESNDEKILIASHILGRFAGKLQPEVVETCVKSVFGQIPNDYSWPGNVREYEQYLRSALIHGPAWRQSSHTRLPVSGKSEANILSAWSSSQWSADEMLAAYARESYRQLGTYEKVAQRLQLDWRTVKKWIQE